MSRLSPIDIQHAEFARRTLGYDRREVRAFLERLSLEVEEALRDAQALRRRLADAEQEVARLRSAEAELQGAVLAAERIAGDLKETAKREAQVILDDAERQRRARLADVDGGLLRSRSELEALEQQRRLFKEQFRALLRAYLTALEADDAQAATFDAQARGSLAADAADALLDDTVRP